MEQSYEPTALELLKQVAARNWPIIVHPGAMHTPSAWACLGDCLCIENMDKRKPIGQTATTSPNSSTRCRTPPYASTSATPAKLIHHERSLGNLAAFSQQDKTLHVSEVNTKASTIP